MTVTQIWRASRTRVAGGRVLTADGGRGHRARRRLWPLLNAQALLDGTAAPPGGVLPIEDDRRRMAARRAS